MARAAYRAGLFLLAVSVDFASRRGLVVTGDRRGEAVVLQIGPENDALSERIDRRGARGAGRHCAAREIALDGIPRCGIVTGHRVAVELRVVGLRHLVATRGVIGGQGIDLVEGDFVPVARDHLIDALGHVQDEAIAARIADQRRHARTHVHVHRNVGAGDVGILVGVDVAVAIGVVIGIGIKIGIAIEIAVAVQIAVAVTVEVGR